MKRTYILLGILSAFSSCDKFLAEKPDAKLAVINSLEDAQALLDYYPNVDRNDVGVSEASADSYFLSDAEWARRAESDQRIYLWEKDQLFMPDSRDWRQSYANIYTANAVLESLKKIKRTTQNALQYDNVAGQAHLLRGRTFLMLVWTWGLAYDEQTAAQNLGVPLRLNTNFNEKVPRANLEQTYQQVIDDLKAASKYLPLRGNSKLRGSKLVAWGWLSRTYLSQRVYEPAASYADSVLQVQNTLLDYNQLNSAAAFPIPELNAEIVMDTRLSTPATLAQSRAKMDSTLILSYAANDLRKKIYFRINTDKSYAFKGNYAGGPTFFSGIAVDEMYLNRAEGFARTGLLQKSMDDLNTLLLKRHSTGTYVPLQNLNQTLLIERVLEERKKELIFRGLRWMDIKRWNAGGAQLTLKRRINGQEYVLLPNDLRYAIAIPQNALELGGIEDNPR
ncbi:RagB/SusD family nutrient uptake outer membrane protein [Pedobacter cryophilus]|uniref:RagB/SusD family nutrient uptake outer membrane protein n=1 Tax=Pedobacter cryophilus TaxID=2571271 RepID=A0A4U1C5L9_9SPHI|nr:RagB/SusD family nutrient uptake outer membrane protein [Pedobacter cryophilus]TKB98640.1 RagB/SusD family nutrient uptake outer membrane protein [Pedobacter cryophilus]